jgi:hypothetical protein
MREPPTFGLRSSDLGLAGGRTQLAHRAPRQLAPGSARQTQHSPLTTLPLGRQAATSRRPDCACETAARGPAKAVMKPSVSRAARQAMRVWTRPGSGTCSPPRARPRSSRRAGRAPARPLTARCRAIGETAMRTLVKRKRFPDTVAPLANVARGVGLRRCPNAAGFGTCGPSCRALRAQGRSVMS